MRIVEGFDVVAPVETIQPKVQTLPIVFNSPHSGNFYPRSFLDSSQLDSDTIRNSEDAFVDFLFSDVVFHGSPLIRANFPRAFLDVNREPFELDPNMFNGHLPPYVNSRSLKVAGGLGTIAKIVGDSQEIYCGRLSIQEGLERIKRFYRPYHNVLGSVLEKTRSKFGFAILIDCHSMPSLKQEFSQNNRPDFIIGDRYGTSCISTLTQTLEDVLVGYGYSVVRNTPFAGGFITSHYGNPSSGIHAIQLEIKRSLYMEEDIICLANDATRLKSELSEIAMRVDTSIQEGYFPDAVAAE